jgi:hypothetical protein
VRILRVALVLGSVLLVSQQAGATLISYSSRAVFDVATSGTTNIDFEAQNTAPPFTYYGGGLAISGVSFTNPGNSYLYVADVGAVPPGYNWGSGANLLFGSNAEGSRFHIALPAGTTAFGFDFMTEDDSNTNTGDIGSYTFVVDGASTFSGTSLTRPNRAFFGVVSDIPISAVDVNLLSAVGGSRPLGVIDNFEFGTAAAVPEPASLMLLGTGLLGLVARRRRAL